MTKNYRTVRPTTSSFSARRLNGTTFVVLEDDAFREHPLIYIKLHPRSNLIVLNDTGCDEPSEKHKHDEYIHLREWIENCPLDCNDNKPLNPGGTRQYMVICTHCHFDHMLGITQFLAGGTTQIIASAAGRDFVESDLETNGIYKDIGVPAPYYQVTKWAQAFERLGHTDTSGSSIYEQEVDLGITILHTPGHTPDELAWYDHDEMHLYVGDSFYEEGEDGMPIVWPMIQGNMIEWVFSMEKLREFVKSENARTAAEYDNSAHHGQRESPRRVLISCGHQTSGVDGEQILERLNTFWWRVVRGEVPVKTIIDDGLIRDIWRDVGENRTKMSFLAPRVLMEKAREFFKGTGKY